jgi:hypothetical protein
MHTPAVTTHTHAKGRLGPTQDFHVGINGRETPGQLETGVLAEAPANTSGVREIIGITKRLERFTGFVGIVFLSSLPKKDFRGEIFWSSLNFFQQSFHNPNHFNLDAPFLFP